MKMTKQEVGHFTSISGHFFANYIKSYHKTEVLAVILKGPTCQILIGLKAVTSITKYLVSIYFQFCKKKIWKLTTHKWPFYDHFWPFFGNYMKVSQKTETQPVVLRCLVSQNLNWIKSYDIISVKFFSMPEKASFQG